MKILLSHGANVSSKDKLGRTPLHYAATNGCFQLVQLLLDNGAEIDSKYEVHSLPRSLEILNDFGISKAVSLKKLQK